MRLMNAGGLAHMARPCTVKTVKSYPFRRSCFQKLNWICHVHVAACMCLRRRSNCKFLIGSIYGRHVGSLCGKSVNCCLFHAQNISTLRTNTPYVQFIECSCDFIFHPQVERGEAAVESGFQVMSRIMMSCLLQLVPQVDVVPK